MHDARHVGDDWEMEIAVFRKPQGLADNVINSILEDHEGRLWMGCERGVFTVMKEELHAVAEGRRRAVECVTFDESDGVPSAETTGQKSQPCAWNGPDGRLWFATTKGIAILDPNSVLRGSVSPRVVIEEVRADNDPVYMDGSILDPGMAAAPGGRSAATSSLGGRSDTTPSLGGWSGATPSSGNGSRARIARPSLQSVAPYSRGPNGTEADRTREVASPSSAVPPPRLPPGRARVVEIHYTANHFAAPEKIRFRYRISGIDKEWIDAGTRRLAIYTGLPPGHHRFEVIAGNSHGQWSAPGASFAFFLAPHFWQTIWFLPTVTALVITLALSLYRWRLKELRRFHKLEQENALARERDRIARDMHDELGTELTRIAVLGDQVRRQGDNLESLRSRLDEMANAARRAVDTASELVWWRDSRNDTLEGLVSYVGSYAECLCESAGLACRLDFPDAIPETPVSADFRKAVFLSAKEAMTNIVKHAHAYSVAVTVSIDPGELRMKISDDGCGFDAVHLTREGHGLRNIRQRIETQGGTVNWERGASGGTTLQVRVPLG